MNKLVKIKGNYYLLSEEEAYPYAFHIKNKEILYIDLVGTNSGELFHSKGFSYENECMKIIASTDSSLLLPILYRENMELLVDGSDKSEWIVDVEDKYSHVISGGFRSGFGGKGLQHYEMIYPAITKIYL